MIGLFLEGNLQSLWAGDRMAGIRVCKQRHRFTQRVSPHASAHLPLLAGIIDMHAAGAGAGTGSGGLMLVSAAVGARAGAGDDSSVAVAVAGTGAFAGVGAGAGAGRAGTHCWCWSNLGGVCTASDK